MVRPSSDKIAEVAQDQDDDGDGDEAPDESGEEAHAARASLKAVVEKRTALHGGHDGRRGDDGNDVRKLKQKTGGRRYGNAWIQMQEGADRKTHRR